MGGTTQGPVQNTNQQLNKTENTNQNFNTKSSNDVQQQLTPWAPGAGILGNILSGLGGIDPNLTGNETDALQRLGILGQSGNNFQPGVNNVANTLLGGGKDNTGTINSAYANIGNQLNPVANASLNPWETPGFSDAWKTLQGDISSGVNGQFAAAGRDLSGMNTQTLARGLMQGGGQLLANQYNQNVNNRINAANSLFGAGQGTTGMLSQLEQARLGNLQAGVPAAQSAFEMQQSGPMLMLQAEAAKRGIPLETLAKQMGIALPATQAFGKQQGTSVGSTAGNTYGTTNTVGNTNQQQSTQTPLWQTLLGGGLGGAGLLSGMGAFGQNGLLGGLFNKPQQSSSPYGF